MLSELFANQAFVGVCGTLSGAVGLFLVQLLTARSPLHSSNATLKAENATGQEEKTDLQNRIVELTSKVAELERTIQTSFGRETIHLRYPIDPTTNLRKKDGHYFCPKCFPESLTEIIPKNGKYYCDKCKKKTTTSAFIGQP